MVWKEADSDTVKALRMVRDDAKRALDVAQKAMNEALIAEFKYKVGDILESTTGKQAKVTAVWVAYDTVTFTTRMKKKDGTWGLQAAPFYRPEWRDSKKVGHEEPTPA